MSINFEKMLRVLAGILSISVLHLFPVRWRKRRLRKPAPRRAYCRPEVGRLSSIHPTPCLCCSIIRRVCSRPSRTSVWPTAFERVMLAKLATLMKIPVITTASEPNGTNGRSCRRFMNSHDTLSMWLARAK